ncbi:hypothetical protein FND50_12100 [Rhodococcus sp. WB9]|nr:hypothetical protein FND50_12100 [Rhodococcus sp. WB9]
MLPGGGSSGCRISHWASVTDDGYTAQRCPPIASGGQDGHGEMDNDGMGGLLGSAVTSTSPTQPGAHFHALTTADAPRRVLNHPLRDVRETFATGMLDV